MPAFDPATAGESYCYLTTTGRVTGDPHTIEIWFDMTDDGAELYLLSGGGARSDWVKNLRADPSVSVRIGSRQAEEHAGVARVIEAGDEDDAVRRMLAGKYQGWDESKTMSSWARTALCIVVEPEQ